MPSALLDVLGSILTIPCRIYILKSRNWDWSPEWLTAKLILHYSIDDDKTSPTENNISLLDLEGYLYKILPINTFLKISQCNMIYCLIIPILRMWKMKFKQVKQLDNV